LNLSIYKIYSIILFNKGSFVRYYPRLNDFIVDYSLEDIKELDSFCDMIYSFTKKLGDNFFFGVMDNKAHRLLSTTK